MKIVAIRIIPVAPGERLLEQYSACFHYESTEALLKDAKDNPLVMLMLEGMLEGVIKKALEGEIPITSPAPSKT